MSYDDRTPLSEQAIQRLRVGAPEDLTFGEIDALLDYIVEIEAEVSLWKGRHKRLLKSIGGVSPS